MTQQTIKPYIWLNCLLGFIIKKKTSKRLDRGGVFFDLRKSDTLHF